MFTVAVVNQKGGVGKTTVVLGLASAASARGIDTLVVDLDPQGNATTGLGVFEPGPGVDAVLADERPGGLAGVIEPGGWPAEVGPVPSLAASSPELSIREPLLATDPLGAQDRLAMALRPALRAAPDAGSTAVSDDRLVLIDCPPSLGLLTVNALFAADAVLVVTEPGAWAVDGVGRMLQTIDRIRMRRSDGRPAIAGIAVNRLGRTRDGRYWNEQLQEAYPERCLPPVHLRAAVSEAAAQSMPIHALRRPGATEAAAEFDELLARVAPLSDLAEMGADDPGAVDASEAPPFMERSA
ncbi:MAG TPA: ParA family protein [Acidimicrobiales bacterium]|jgi:chromosome partitioning protein|nr:ParA family protein [Actinomycetes bacterium]HJM74044.1 ParA family protein [Acidimicrobiales bacterium]